MVRKVAIIGGGISAGALVIQLLRGGEEMEIHVFEKEEGRRMWAGVAYGTPADWHLINIPSYAMSIIEDDADHLSRWLERKRAAGKIDAKWGTDKAMHIPRGMFGEYVGETIEEEMAKHPATKVNIVRGEVTVANESGIILEDGTMIAADVVVLCSGNFSPSNVKFHNSEHFYSTTKRYLQNPWKHLSNLHEVIPPTARVGIIGSRLTAVDVLLTLANTNHEGEIHLMSRTGLLPKSNHAEFLPPLRDVTDIVPITLPEDVSDIKQDGAGLPGVSIDVDKLFTTLIDNCKRVEAEGGVWQTEIDSMRPVFNKLWMCMSTEERGVFLSKFRDEFEIRRHRVAPGIMEAIEKILEKAPHHVGHIKSMTQEDPCGPVKIELDTSSFEVDWVINCTGPQLDFRHTPPSALFTQLITTSLATPEQTGIGLLVDTTTGQLLSPDLAPSPYIYAIGPVRKGSEWETIAVKDIRKQAQGVAQAILSSGKANGKQ
eukprot:TRINITY_DN1675_c2_g1_i1.p1 TRINITY_DN1675_c2_g1~~TRINITY_DN1675_c2_g1_i1.p1  ORF type:complete len:501 (+),score=199.73 TRINITY_DN1675_c2_g1_i1:47-1504(+)